LSFFRVIISEIISNVHGFYFQWLQSCGFFLCCLGAHERSIADVCVNVSNHPPTAVKYWQSILGWRAGLSTLGTCQIVQNVRKTIPFGWIIRYGRVKN
jgi:hypothetical protein